MPLRDGTKELATNDVWASSPTANRTDPDDASLTPALVIANGWPASFSADAGDTPRRRVFNEMYWRRDSALKDVINFGILPWDTAVDTLEGGVKQVSGVIYRALADNGPTYSNAISPTMTGQTVWEIVSGTIGLPSAPAQPTATAPASGELDWTWNCPLDGGSIITSFNVYWRVSGGSFSNAISVTTPRYVQTGLTNGTAIEIQVEAANSQGTSPRSPTGTATPQGTVPGGGATLALRATAGDGEVDLDWLEPDDGGESITSYTVQWRATNQNFGTGRQATSTDTEHTVGSLTNGTVYFFQVRAVNSEGNSAWSNEAAATPEAIVVPPTPPADTAPDAPAGLAGTPRRPLIVDWTWELPDDDGGQSVEDYDFQWRYQGDAWANANIVSGLGASYYRLTIANTNNGVQARVRASNSVGTGSWSSTVTVAAADLLGNVQTHRFTTSQTWVWPYDDLDRATVLIYGAPYSIINPNLAIDLPNATWLGGASDGTTLWFLRSSPNQLVAYNASDLQPNAARNINNVGGASGVVTDGITLWVIRDQADTADAYSIATLASDAARNINLGTGTWLGGVASGNIAWFVSGTTARAWNLSTRTRVSAMDITLGAGTWVGGASDDTTLWFLDSADDVAYAYTASTGARDADNDIELTNKSWSGGLSTDSAMWFINDTDDIAVGFAPPSITSVTVGGTTYTTAGDADGVVTQTLTGIADSASFVIALQGSGFVEVFPQC